MRGVAHHRNKLSLIFLFTIDARVDKQFGANREMKLVQSNCISIIYRNSILLLFFSWGWDGN